MAFKGFLAFTLYKTITFFLAHYAPNNSSLSYLLLTFHANFALR
jgi:hypothetical protein